MKRILLSAAAILFATAAYAAGPDLNGQWSIHQSIAGNESDQACSFVQKDNAITGTCKSMEGKDLAVTGSVDGNKLTWKYDSEYNGSPLTLVYTAEAYGDLGASELAARLCNEGIAIAKRA